MYTLKQWQLFIKSPSVFRHAFEDKWLKSDWLILAENAKRSETCISNENGFLKIDSSRCNQTRQKGFPFQIWVRIMYADAYVGMNMYPSVNF